jgi:hypothetical protein
MALDPRIKKALNEFHKTQPALNLSDMPVGQRGILLGDIIDELYNDMAVIAAKLDSDTGVADEDYVEVSTEDNATNPELG